jgi:lipoyl(octanoyl) transferase
VSHLELIEHDGLPYDEALALQRRRREQVLAGGPGAFFLVTHPPTVTLGRHANPASVIGRHELERRGVPVIETDRGGDVTFHGPGQLVGYPVFDLTRYGLGAKRYVELLGQVLKDVLGPLGIDATWDDAAPGLWTARGKIAAVGVHLHRNVPIHGFALNVDVDLGWFDLIVPCGLTRPVTSIARELDDDACDMSAIRSGVVQALESRLRQRDS